MVSLSQRKPLLNNIPGYQLPYCLKVIESSVSVVCIVGVLPHVESQQGFQPSCDGILCVLFLGDDQAAIVGS